MTVPINPALLSSRWPAAWCRHPDDRLRRGTPAVFLFRRVVTLAAAPAASFIVHVSADARYELFVNGTKVCWGPAQGDLLNWRFESVDIAPHLRAGKNVLAARVTFFAHLEMMAQISAEAALLVQGDTDMEKIVNTPGPGWKVWRDDAYTFFDDELRAIRTYCCVGPSEFLDLARHPHGWERAGFDDAGWPDAVLVPLNSAAPRGIADADSPWWLVPRAIPAMEETPQPFGRLVRRDHEDAPPPNGTAGIGEGEGAPLIIGPRTRATQLFDHGNETTAFPEIVASGGAGATLRLAYAEALVDAEGKKGDRNETHGRILKGYGDTWTLDGGADRLLRPTWWRTFRYAELSIETQSAPVTLSSLRAVYTGYPFVHRARFDATELPDAADLITIGWRTARLCAHETYMDCPYYEQLHYAGDTRIQCLVSLYASGDARLFRNALQQLNDSRFPDGLTMSRSPSRIRQVIPPFSLWWVGMVHDYWRHVPGDDAFIRSLLPGMRGVLDWFRARLRPDGLLGPLPWWNFVDWAREWPKGVPPGATNGGSSILTLQYALACNEMADLEAALGRRAEAKRCEEEWAQASEAVWRLCYDSATGRVADTPEKKTFSQHAAILAVLADDLVNGGRRRKITERVLSDPALTQATFYFRFYLNRALVKAGLGDRYLETLGPWRDMRKIGLTTWAENPEPTRSDCHAWSSSPNYEFLATVLGIGPGAPGFARVRIAPHLGSLTHASGAVPHPRNGGGEIAVSYRRAPNGTLDAEITLPTDLAGELIWRARTVLLHGGTQRVSVDVAAEG